MSEEIIEFEEMPEVSKDFLLKELLLAFLPPEEKTTEVNFLAKFLELEEKSKGRIVDALRAGNTAEAKVLSAVHIRFFDSGIIAERGAGNSRVLLRFDRSKGQLSLDKNEGKKVIALSGMKVTDMLKEFFFKAKEIIDEDDFMFI